MDTSDTVELARLRAFLESGAAKSVRVNNRLSLREMARTIGISPSTVLRWEAQERVPRGAPALRYWRLIRELMSS